MTGSADEVRTAEIVRRIERWGDFSRRLHEASLLLGFAFLGAAVKFDVATEAAPDRTGPTGWLRTQADELENRVTLVVEAFAAASSAELQTNTFVERAFAAIAVDQMSERHFIRLLELDHERAFAEVAQLIRAEGDIVSLEQQFFIEDLELDAAERSLSNL